jgi:hypothetical protein
MKLAVELVALLLLIQEIPYSDLDPKTGYFD